LLKVQPAAALCHTGDETCFADVLSIEATARKRGKRRSASEEEAPTIQWSREAAEGA
jgi:hypothetical protein